MHKKFWNNKLFTTYLVGGAVRDELLGLPCDDMDYVVVANPGITREQMDKYFDDMDYQMVGKDFPVYRKDELDIAYPRVERKVGIGSDAFEVEVIWDIKKDLMRRDFSMNSVAYNVQTKEYIEPEGVSAKKDLAQKKIRPTSDAFNEDPLRYLRLARMSAKFPEFEVVYEEFLPMLTDTVKEEIKTIPRERMAEEIKKTLKAKRPSNFFKVLKELDVLDIVMPDIAKMVGKEQSLKHHAEGDVFDHTMFVLDEVTKLSNNPKVRFGALMHDIGKAYTYEITQEQGKDLGEAYYGHADTKLNKKLFEVYVEGFKFKKEYVEFAYRSAVIHHYLHTIENLSPQKLTMLILNIPSKRKGKKEELEEGQKTSSEILEEIFEKDEFRAHNEAKKKQKVKKSEKMPPMIVGLEDIGDLITVAKSDAYGRVAQKTKDEHSPLISLTENEVLEVFEKGSIKKEGSLFQKGQLDRNVDYELLYDLYDYVKKNASRYYVGDKIKNKEFHNEEGKLDESLKEMYIYEEMLKVVKEFKHNYNKKKEIQQNNMIH